MFASGEERRLTGKGHVVNFCENKNVLYLRTVVGYSKEKKTIAVFFALYSKLKTIFQHCFVKKLIMIEEVS